MKLLRILGVFLVLSLFAGCEVWISFWGSADEDRSIQLDVTYPYGSVDELRATLYQEIGGGYSPVKSITAGVSTTLTTTFEDLSDDVYKVVVWNDLGSPGDNQPGFGSEVGFTTGPIELFLFSEYTVDATTSSEWQQDGSVSVTVP